MRAERERLPLIAEILVAYGRARSALRREVPIATVVRDMRGAGGDSADREPEALEEARRLGWIVVRAMRLLPGDTRCLRRSLVLTQLLARRGIDSRLVIGARDEPEFLAHAWVEHGGVPVLDPGDGSFGRLVTL